MLQVSFQVLHHLVIEVLLLATLDDPAVAVLPGAQAGRHYFGMGVVGGIEEEAVGVGFDNVGHRVAVYKE